MKIPIAIIAVLLVWTVAGVVGHSWLDCTDWRFNDPNKQEFKDDDGYCAGYARRYPAGTREYGTYDGFRYFRHYVQDPDWKTNPDKTFSDRQPACSQFDRVGNDGVTLVGSDERLGSPVTAAYYPNSDGDGKTVGNMTVTESGATLCWRWPAKNHAGHVNDQNMVYVYWSTTPNSPADPTQQELLQAEVAQLRFRNCPEPGVPSPSDQTGTGSDRMPCGGCFTVPEREPGVYLVQWRWQLNSGEYYASCSDIEIKPAGSSSASAVTVSSLVFCLAATLALFL